MDHPRSLAHAANLDDAAAAEVHLDGDRLAHQIGGADGGGGRVGDVLVRAKVRGERGNARRELVHLDALADDAGGLDQHLPAGEIPRHSAASAAVARLSSMPRDPVAAFACPAFTSTARAVSDASTISRQYNTGAAAKTFVVNTPAKTAGSSATTSAQSARRPDARRPALWAAALNPPGGHHAAGNHLPRSRREERFDGRVVELNSNAE